MIKFSSLVLHQWRQFYDVQISFHPRLTIITGSNGAGKSTILNICSHHFGYGQNFLATPRKKKGGGIAYDAGYHRAMGFDGVQGIDFEDEIYDDDIIDPIGLYNADLFTRRYASVQQPHKNLNNNTINIGTVSYDNGEASYIGLYDGQAQAHGITLANHQQVVGVPISSHRVASAYQSVGNLPLNLANISTAYSSFFNEYWTRMTGGTSKYSPIFRMKETLIAMAAFGQGNEHLEKNDDLLAAFNGFVDVLRHVLPRELGFQNIVVRIPDVVLKTRSGEFILDASSGGITAVIEIAWQIYLFSLYNKVFVVTLDEPENHLHPSMQRSILSNLLSAFPQAQFIVATHSPFIVSAVEDSHVYALKYTGSVDQMGLPTRGPRRVQSVYLDQSRKAGSAAEVLKEVLGVSVSIPDWAARRLDAIIADFSNASINSENLDQLRNRLSEAGFEEYYPDALAQIVRTR